MSQQRREERPRRLTLEVRTARPRAASTVSRTRDSKLELVLRALDVLCIFIAASSAPAALPVAAAFAAVIGAVQLRHVPRVRRRARVLFLLGALMSIRVLLLIIAAGELTPSHAALAAAATPLLSIGGPIAPLLTIGALMALARDASSASPPASLSLAMLTRRGAKDAIAQTDSDSKLDSSAISREKTVILTKEDEAESKRNQTIPDAPSEHNAADDAAAEQPADDEIAADVRAVERGLEKGSQKGALDKESMSVRQSQRRHEAATDAEKRRDSAETSGTGRKMSAPHLVDDLDPSLKHGMKNGIEAPKSRKKKPSHVTRHVLAVLSEKKADNGGAAEAEPRTEHGDTMQGDESLRANGSHSERKKAVTDEDNRRAKVRPDDSNSDSTAKNNAGKVAVGNESGLLWSVVCVALVVLASVLGEAANGISRALIAEIGNCSVIVLCASVASLLVQTPFLLLLASDKFPFFGWEDFQLTENIATQGAFIGLLSFISPAFVLRRIESWKSTSLVLSGSPTIASPSGSSEARAVLRVARVRLQAITKVSVELCIFSLILIPLLHLLVTWIFDSADDISFLSLFAASLIFILSWLESRRTYRSADADVGIRLGTNSTSIFSVHSVLFALWQSVKQAFGIVHASSVNTVHVARTFILQSQANKASWQVLNFFLLQAGMVLLESLYVLTTKTSGLILVSADNIFCCVALALGLYAIRRGSNTRAQDSARFESLTGFANGVLLVYVAVLVVLEAVERHLERGSLEYAHTFSVCVLGIIGNLAGLVFFPPESRRENHNVQSIYLHIWGNTLAFVGVAAGAIKPTYPMLGIVGALIVGVIVAGSAAPLLVRSARVLLRARAGSAPARRLTAVAPVLRRLPGVRACEEARAWMLGDVEVAAVRIVIASNSAHDVVLRSARECMASAGFPRARAFIQVIGDDGVVAASGSVPGFARGVHRRAASSGPPDALELEGLYIQRGLRDGNA